MQSRQHVKKLIHLQANHCLYTKAWHHIAAPNYLHMTNTHNSRCQVQHKVAMV